MGTGRIDDKNNADLAVSRVVEGASDGWQVPVKPSSKPTSFPNFAIHSFRVSLESSPAVSHANFVGFFP